MDSGLSPSRWWAEPKWQAFLALALSFFTTVMAMSMVFVLLAAIAEDFGVTLRAIGWVVIVESLIVSALLLPLGGLADLVGRRRIYLTGLTVFGVGSVLTGLAPGFAALIAARVVMAVGNAMVQSVGTGMIAAAFPAHEKGRAMGAQTTAVSAGAASGPLVGGFALQVVGWQTLFLLLAVPVAVSIVAGLLFLEDDRPTHGRDRPGFDGIGSLLSATAVVTLVVTIGNPFAQPWISPPIIGGFVAVVVLLASFVRWELGHRQPMLELRLFSITMFRSAVLVRFLGFTASTTTSLLLPIYLLSLRGLADGLAGAVVFCSAAGLGIAAQISGQLSDRVGPRAPTMFGLTLQIVVAAAFSTAGQNTPLWFIAILTLASGFSMGMWNVPNNSAMLGSVPRRNFAVIGAFTNVTRTMGSVVGQALVTAVVVAVMVGDGFDIPLGEIADTAGAGDAFLGGWRVAYFVAIAITVVTLALSTALPSSSIESDR